MFLRRTLSFFVFAVLLGLSTLLFDGSSAQAQGRRGFWGGRDSGGSATSVEAPRGGGRSVSNHLIPAPLPGEIFTVETVNKRQAPVKPAPAVTKEKTKIQTQDKADVNQGKKQDAQSTSPNQANQPASTTKKDSVTESGLVAPGAATALDTVVENSAPGKQAPIAPQPSDLIHGTNPSSSAKPDDNTVPGSDTKADASNSKSDADEDDANKSDDAKPAAPVIVPKGKNFMIYSPAEYKLGYPEADKILAILESEMRLQFRNRPSAQQGFDTWIGYLRARTASSARTSGIGGYNGVARLAWYERLLLNPLHAPIETEEFSRYIHAGIIYGGTKGYNHTLKTIRPKMGIGAGVACPHIAVSSPEEAYQLLWTRLAEVKGLHAKAISGLKPDELKVMNANLYNVMTVNANVGHTVNNRTAARNFIQYMKKIDYSAYYDAAAILLSFSETDFLDNLQKLDNKTIGDVLVLAAEANAPKPEPNEDKQSEGEQAEGDSSESDISLGDLSSVDEKSEKAPAVDVGSVLDSGKVVERAPIIVPGVKGEVLMEIKCPAGKIIVGGRGPNVYDIEKIPNLCAIIDLGGNDTYLEGMVSMNRPLLVIIDLQGDDLYRGKLPAIQGSAILGLSLLIDRQGNDQYQAKHLAQGSCLGGVGILLDMGGNDAYGGIRRVQGTALAGLGMLIDQGGNDNYHAAMWSQGLGHPLGFGLLDDVDGKDFYYTGGIYPDSYDDTPGYEGWGQGLGSGLRDIANGGIGVLLDGGGDDRYEYDYIAHGGGYWQGIGILRDFSGNDVHAGATEKEFNRGPRKERRFQRLGNGFGCHYAIGFLFDDFGNDTYASTIMNSGFGWDASSGFLVDFQGNDKYTAVGGGSDGNGAQASLGVLFDYDGDDIYSGRGQGYASPSINPEYHQMPGCGGNFAFVIDYGGDDKYGCGVANNGAYQRGAAGGYLIDRPVNPEKTIPPPRK